MMKRQQGLRLGAVVVALLVWQIAAMAIARQSYLLTPLAPPTVVFQRLLALSRAAGFWQAVFYSFARIAWGFFAALFLGAVLAVAASPFAWLEALLWPYIAVMKSTPVASFIILCLILLKAPGLPAFVAFLMVVPIMYTNILHGLHSTDTRLLEMATVFRLSFGRRLMYIYLPQLKPYLLSACSTSLGMAWKAGVAAEVIGVTTGSIGEQLYYAKVYLDFPALFAWTSVIILISVLTERAFLALLKKGYAWWEGR